MGAFDNLFKKKKAVHTEAVEPEAVESQYGKSGTMLSGGMLDVEYNNNLVFPYSITEFDKMRKSDATVAAVLKALKLPLLSAKWEVKAASEDPEDIKIMEFVDKNFRNIGKQAFLKEALSYLDF